MKYQITVVVALITWLLSACSEQNKSNEIHFATFAGYPPFEYSAKGELKGFDIELAQLVAKKLGKTAVFDNMQFSTILPAIAAEQDDAGIATITITDERKKNFDFTIPYYYDGMATVYKKAVPVVTIDQFSGKKMAAQLGSVMEIWLQKHFPEGVLTSYNSNNQAIEALVAGHVDVVLLDGALGSIYCKQHPELAFSLITKAEEGYGIVLKKGSPLTQEMNQALKQLMAAGEIEKLKSKWLGAQSWKP